LNKPIRLPWSEIASLQFQRLSQPSRPISGLQVKLLWRSAPGSDARDLDTVEGALTSADDNAFRLETPYAGTLVVPRDRVRRVEIEGKGTRIVVDPTAHHLGDEVARGAEALDPPQPEGGKLERSFTLKDAPAANEQSWLLLQVHRVVGEANGLRFSQLIRQGELRTKVYVNDKEIDYLNKYVTTDNETPERIRIPVPTGLLKAGENRLKILQTGTADDPNYLDDLGILGISVEFRKP
jgi:hypothetical protein